MSCRILKDNWYLSDIEEDAFEGATGPSSLWVAIIQVDETNKTKQLARRLIQNEWW